MIDGEVIRSYSYRIDGEDVDAYGLPRKGHYTCIDIRHPDDTVTYGAAVAGPYETPGDAREAGRMLERGETPAGGFPIIRVSHKIDRDAPCEALDARGCRFRLRRDVERFPHFTAEMGTVVVVEVWTRDVVRARPRTYIDGTGEWDGRIEWRADMVQDDARLAFLADAEAY